MFSSFGKKIIVDVRNHSHLIALLKFLKCGHGIGERRPCGDGLVQGSHLGGTGMETAALSELPDDRFQNIPIALVSAALGLRFKFAIDFEDGSVRHGLPVSSEDSAKGGENAGFPVNQGTVAVERDGAEGREIHG